MIGTIKKNKKNKYKKSGQIDKEELYIVSEGLVEIFIDCQKKGHHTRLSTLKVNFFTQIFNLC